MITPEILAPAGTFEALTAAVRSGADAVYFGTGNFNARRNAENFSGDELFRAVDFCHSHGVKVHITLNTLVKDDELPELEKTVKRICEAKADALILQDLGVARIVREMCPEIELHASTQLSTGTLDGLNELKVLGFSRAVLPRELSESEIQYLCENSPIELEMFIHGALCMCVSGQCLLSAMLGSRSGNRGLCAQPCRLPFEINGGTGHDLSLKDLSLVEYASKLSNMGISSFKIEGRMKRPEYVAAAVTALKKSFNGEYSNFDAEELKSLFSRSGFTTGYFDKKLGRDMFGYREKENVTSASTELLKKYAHIYEKENAVFTVDFDFSVQNGKQAELTAQTGEYTAVVSSNILPQQAVSRPLNDEIISTQLSKCGGTVFSFNTLKCDIGENLSLPLSEINSMRRRVLSALDEKIKTRKAYAVNDFDFEIVPHKAPEKPETYLSFRNVDEMPDSVSCDRLFLPLDTPPETIKSYNAGVIIPRGIFGNFDDICHKIENSKAEFALCNTLDAVTAAKKCGVTVIGGPSLNIFNSIALFEAEKLGVSECVLSYEMTVQQIKAVGATAKRGVSAYGRTPLMLTRNCPVKNGKTCAECRGKSSLIDRKGICFPVVCSNGFSELLNSRPTYMGDRLNEIKNVDFLLLEFSTETKAEAEKIITAYKSGLSPDGEFTRGLFYRGVE